MSNHSAASAARADDVFDALGDPTRRQIIARLRPGPSPVGKLADQLTIGRPAVSKHLRVLEDAGLRRHASRGTRNLYARAPEGMAVAQPWLVMRIPAAASNWRAMAPAATRAAVSRALARSRMSRTSSRAYLAMPARSACPGRGRVTGARLAPVAFGAGSGPVCMVRCQFTQSRFSMSMAIGPPIVWPARTPEMMSARSDSMAIRRPRP